MTRHDPPARAHRRSRRPRLQVRGGGRRVLLPFLLAAAGVWGWALPGLPAAPVPAGLVEAALATGGLGLVPLHCVPRERAAAEVAALRRIRWPRRRAAQPGPG